MFLANDFPDLIEKFFGFIFIDIINNRVYLMDKQPQIIIYFDFVWRMFPRKIISVSDLKFDSYKMIFVDFAHQNIGVSTH